MIKLTYCVSGFAESPLKYEYVQSEMYHQLLWNHEDAKLRVWENGEKVLSVDNVIIVEVDSNYYPKGE